MSKKAGKLLKKKSEKERERDKIIFNMFNYGCTAGFLSVGFIGGFTGAISEKLKDAEELSVNGKKLKEFIQPFSGISLGVILVVSVFYSYYGYKYKEVSKELEKIQEKLEDELDELE